MQKFMLFVLCVIVMFTLISCEPLSYDFNYEELKEEVIAVELIYYQNKSLKITSDVGQVLPFDEQQQDVIEVMKSDRQDEFLKEFQFIHVWVKDDFLTEPDGYCIKLIYENGDFSVFSCFVIASDQGYGLAVRYDMEGNVISVMGKTALICEFENFINNYFESMVVDGCS